MFSLYMSLQTPLLQLSARVSDYHFIVAMSLLDSKSKFDSRAQQVGLVEEVVQALSDKGIASLAQLGFAAGTPNTTDETSLRAWASETLGSLSVPLGQEIALRRLLFTAHTLIIASLKEEVARASSAADVVRKLPPVEREARLTKLREKLPGIDLTRHQEPSYELVDAFSAMLEARSVRWVPFHRCTSREQELSARSYNKELQVMQSQPASHVQQRLKSPASPPSTPCRSGALTSSILLHNSLHKASRQLLWSSSRRQTRSCGWAYPTRWVPPCRVIMISLWTKPSKSSCSLRPLRCSCSLGPRGAARTSQGFAQRAWQVPRQVQGPWQGSAQFPGALGRKRVERPQLAGRVALLELQHGAAMPEEAVPIEASVHEVLWASPLYLVHSPVTRARAGQFR